MSLPLNCCLAAPEGAQEALAQAKDLLAHAGIAMEDAALAVALAEERALGPQSPWWPFLQVVGDPPANFPGTFEVDDLAELQSHPLEERLTATAKAYGSLAELRGLGTTELLQAMHLVHSRRFGCDDGRVMFPVGDLLNHSFEPSCEIVTPQGDVLTWQIRTKRHVSKGEPLTHRYCDDPNHMLLLNSGFVVPGNPNNRIMARPCDLRRCLSSVMRADVGEVFAGWRQAQIEEQLPDPEGGAGMSMLLLGPGKDGGLMWNPLWLNLCGLAIISSAQDPHWSTRPGGKEDYCDAVEKASWGLFATSLDADLRDLAAEEVSANKALALEFRIGQKELLIEAIALLRQQILKT